MTNLLELPLEWILVIGINFFLIILLIILNIINLSKIKKLKRKYIRFMNGSDNLSIEELLEKCIEKVNKVSIKNREIENHINKVERNLLSCVQKVGIVRFNAFDDVGSDLSFSVALLDSNDNGVVLSSLYSRESSSIYAKPLENAKSKYSLSAEEIKAIDIAQKSAYYI